MTNTQQDDYILKSELRKMIEEKISHRLWKEGKEENVKNSTLYDILSELDKLPSGWIPVTERLPEPKQEVLFISGGDKKFGYYVKSAKGNTEYWYSGGGYFPGKITHWMPLPLHP